MMKKIIGYIFYFFGRMTPSFFVGISNYIHTKYNTGVFVKGLKKIGDNPYVMAPTICNGKEYIEIGNDFKCFSRGRIEAFESYNGKKYLPKVVIGNNVNINFDFHLGCINEINIGNDVLIGSRVIIIDHNHGKNDEIGLPCVERFLFSKGKINIGDNVWIGDGVAILPGVTIGANSIIGANAVVTKDIPANSIVVGNPARVIKEIINE